MAEVQKEKKEKLRFTCVSKKGIEKMVMPAAFCEPEGEAAQTLEKGILEDLKERAEWNDCKVIVWGENLYRHDEEKRGIFAGSGLAMGVALGVIYGMLFNNMALGICIGISLGSCFGAVWTMAGKKK